MFYLVLSFTIECHTTVGLYCILLSLSDEVLWVDSSCWLLQIKFLGTSMFKTLDRSFHFSCVNILELMTESYHTMLQEMFQLFGALPSYIPTVRGLGFAPEHPHDTPHTRPFQQQPSEQNRSSNRSAIVSPCRF